MKSTLGKRQKAVIAWLTQYPHASTAELARVAYQTGQTDPTRSQIITVQESLRKLVEKGIVQRCLHFKDGETCWVLTGLRGVQPRRLAKARKPRLVGVVGLK